MRGNSRAGQEVCEYMTATRLLLVPFFVWMLLCPGASPNALSSFQTRISSVPEISAELPPLEVDVALPSVVEAGNALATVSPKQRASEAYDFLLSSSDTLRNAAVLPCVCGLPSFARRLSSGGVVTVPRAPPVSLSA